MAAFRVEVKSSATPEVQRRAVEALLHNSGGGLALPVEDMDGIFDIILNIPSAAPLARNALAHAPEVSIL